jgi:hypothetical protein
MHYQFSGCPEPVVFHAPQNFFDCLWERMSSSTSNGVRKKRLPNSTTTFERKDAPPKGVFTKYSWHIMNIMHVKQIFDTSLVRLDISKSFVDKGDGCYEPLVDDEEEKRPLASKSNFKAIRKKLRPGQECRTFLKIGQVSEDNPGYPFVVEWIPDVLPTMQMGELRIIFQYGHQRDGQAAVW